MTEAVRPYAASTERYSQALAELRAGHKRSHWIWFVFPQITGLGSSEMSRRYAATEQRLGTQSG